jgi:hypothetical protein
MDQNEYSNETLRFITLYSQYKNRPQDIVNEYYIIGTYINDQYISDDIHREIKKDMIKTGYILDKFEILATLNVLEDLAILKNLIACYNNNYIRYIMENFYNNKKR